MGLWQLSCLRDSENGCGKFRVKLQEFGQAGSKEQQEEHLMDNPCIVNKEQGLAFQPIVTLSCVVVW